MLPFTPLFAFWKIQALITAVGLTAAACDEIDKRMEKNKNTKDKIEVVTNHKSSDNKCVKAVISHKLATLEKDTTKKD